jgi:hypothetical protein
MSVRKSKSLLKNGSQKTKRNRKRVLRKLRSRHKSTIITIKAAIISLAICLEEGGMDKTLVEIGQLLKGEISKLIEELVIGKIKRLFQLLILTLMELRAMNKFKVWFKT